LNQATIKWKAPLGSAPFLAAQGIRDTGSVKVSLTANRNGPVVTASGLIFIGSWSDQTVHAYDKDTGKVLWEKPLEANPEGIPAAYEVDGRQYVAFCAAAACGATAPGEGAVWEPGKPEAQGYYVFALPKTSSSAKK
jgi:quinoprotein glucose dehydrogenase